MAPEGFIRLLASLSNGKAQEEGNLQRFDGRNQVAVESECPAQVQSSESFEDEKTEDISENKTLQLRSLSTDPGIIHILTVVRRHA